MFNKVLIANRGEIAVRIMRTCREMGLATVAVYSRVDEVASHVLEADEAVFLGESDPLASYLNIERVIAAARAMGAQAVHPGYGFLAENAEFATACQDAGLVFVGPPPKVIHNLGSKTNARQIMAKAGLPVIPGSMEATLDFESLSASAREIGYPLLVKAMAGGGGKGIRVVEEPGQLREACELAISEAAKAFGDGRVYLERKLISPRHVEIQILADMQGNIVHLFERECSIQRRNQKIIEETPCPALTPEMRYAMGQTAVIAALAANYVNAGTVEFLLAPDGAFYFLEINTRLQVEHTITEMTTGVDLVRCQLEIAAGLPLSLTQEELSQRGHAIECRIYAEDPLAGFLPSPGQILYLRQPSGPGVRNDCGICQGCQIPLEYDPILSKLVVHARTREEARQRMLRALGDYVVLGIKTSIPFLTDVLASQPFIAGATSTDFLEKYMADWRPNPKGADLASLAYILIDNLRSQAPHGVGQPPGWPTPWQTLGQWIM